MPETWTQGKVMTKDRFGNSDDVKKKHWETLAWLGEQGPGTMIVPCVLIAWDANDVRMMREVVPNWSTFPEAVASSEQMRLTLAEAHARIYSLIVPYGADDDGVRKEWVQVATSGLLFQAHMTVSVRREEDGRIAAFKQVPEIDEAGFEPGGLFRHLLEPRPASLGLH